MKVLFIARRFPPSIGGMQRFAYDLSQALPTQDIELRMVTWGGSSRLSLPFVLPVLFLRGLWAALTDRSIDVIHMQDAVLSPLGWLLSKLARRPWVVVAHGLDLTFKLAFYQKVNLFFARKTDAMIAISQATAHEALIRGVGKQRLIVIPLGVSDKPPARTNRTALLDGLGMKPSDTVLLTVGRLAKRKGVAWFIANVLPTLPADVHYVVLGGGVEQAKIESAIQKERLNERVHMLGVADDTVKEQWLSAADIFVMPNITVPGDMEGFGIVAHEAALAELPVVASNIEGIAQALQNNKNGILVAEQDVAAYTQALRKLLKSPEQRHTFGKQARRYTLQTFGWPTIAAEYKAVYKKIIS